MDSPLDSLHSKAKPAVHLTECMRKAEALLALNLANSVCVVAITSAAFPLSSLVLLGIF